MTTGNSPHGRILVVGSGQFAGFSLYVFSSDAPSACGTTVVSVLGMPLSCSGAEGDKTADWPALTTDGPPVAGPGVNKHLLGTVYRSDIGAHQVSYGGHLLYMFDPAPNQFTGEAFPETVAPGPPWHGVWYLASPTKGQPVAGTRTLAPQTLVNGKTVVSAVMYPDAASIFQNSQPITVTVYSYSRDGSGQSACTGSCARTWLPVLTASGAQVTGLPKSAVGTISRPDGTRQVTYHHKPLYLYAYETPRLGGSPPGFLNPATAGNGNGAKGPKGLGGAFSTVSP